MYDSVPPLAVHANTNGEISYPPLKVNHGAPPIQESRLKISAVPHENQERALKAYESALGGNSFMEKYGKPIIAGTTLGITLGQLTGLPFGGLVGGILGGITFGILACFNVTARRVEPAIAA